MRAARWERTGRGRQQCGHRRVPLNHLAASLDERDVADGAYVAKPVLAREGANVSLHDGSGRTLAETGGSYGGGRTVFQRAARLSCVEGRYAVLGSWVVGATPAGIIVREDRGPIITNASEVVPHVVEPAAG